MFGADRRELPAPFAVNGLAAVRDGYAFLFHAENKISEVNVLRVDKRFCEEVSKHCVRRGVDKFHLVVYDELLKKAQFHLIMLRIPNQPESRVGLSDARCIVFSNLQ